MFDELLEVEAVRSDRLEEDKKSRFAFGSKKMFFLFVGDLAVTHALFPLPSQGKFRFDFCNFVWFWAGDNIQRFI